MKKLIVIAIVLIATINTKAQNKIKGKVLEISKNKEEMEISCCPTTDGCDKDTELLQFTFETLVTKKQNIIDCKEISLFNITQNNLFRLSVHDNLITHFQAESPPLVTKPILPEIQSFLL